MHLSKHLTGQAKNIKHFLVKNNLGCTLFLNQLSSDILQMPIEKCWLLQSCVFFRAAKCLHRASQNTLIETSLHTPSYTHQPWYTQSGELCSAVGCSWCFFRAREIDGVAYSLSANFWLAAMSFFSFPSVSLVSFLWQPLLSLYSMFS